MQAPIVVLRRWQDFRKTFAIMSSSNGICPVQEVGFAQAPDCQNNMMQPRPGTRGSVRASASAHSRVQVSAHGGGGGGGGDGATVPHTHCQCPRAATSEKSSAVVCVEFTGSAMPLGRVTVACGKWTGPSRQRRRRIAMRHVLFTGQ